MYFCSNLIKKIKSFVYILTLSVINWYVKMTYILISFILHLFYVIIRISELLHIGVGHASSL